METLPVVIPADALQETRNLKQAYSKYNELSERENNILRQISLLKNELYGDVIQEKKEVRKQLTPDELVVTEHAILRYLERVKGMDLKAIEEEILTLKVREMHKTLGDGKYPVYATEGSDFFVRIKRNKVVTILDKDEHGQQYKHDRH